MAKKIIFIGGGQHAILLAEKILENKQGHILGFIDKQPIELPPFIKDCGAAYLGADDMIEQLKKDGVFHLALGASLMGVRQKLIVRMKKMALSLISIVHQSAYCSPSARIGDGVALLINTVVHTNASIGHHTCINTGAIVEHDCRVGENVFLQPRSVLAGGVRVGDNSVIGIGASVREGVSIGKNCLIGGGAFVCEDIPDHSLAYGVPAKVVEKSPF